MGGLGRLLCCLVLGILFWRELAALDVTRVYFRAVLPLFGKVIQRENRGDRADRHAGPTIDAFYGIDVKLRDLIEARTGVVIRRVLLRVDAIYGAGIDAGGVFCPDARFGNNEGHRTLPRLSEPTVLPRGEEVQAGGIARASGGGWGHSAAVPPTKIVRHDKKGFGQ